MRDFLHIELPKLISMGSRPANATISLEISIA